MFQAYPVSYPLSDLESASLKGSRFFVGQSNIIEENQDRETGVGKEAMQLAAVSLGRLVFLKRELSHKPFRNIPRPNGKMGQPVTENNK